MVADTYYGVSPVYRCRLLPTWPTDRITQIDLRVESGQNGNQGRLSLGIDFLSARTSAVV